MEDLKKEFIEYLSSMAKGFGLHELMVKIFAHLYIEPKEISMEDIANNTGYSLASISNAMKIFETMGGIKRIKKPGTKRVYFYMNKDLMRWNIIKLDYIQKNIIESAKAELPGIIKKYSKQANYEKESLDIIKDYYKQILDFDKLIDKWKKDIAELRCKGQ